MRDDILDPWVAAEPGAFTRGFRMCVGPFLGPRICADPIAFTTADALHQIDVANGKLVILDHQAIDLDRFTAKLDQLFDRAREGGLAVLDHKHQHVICAAQQAQLPIAGAAVSRTIAGQITQHVNDARFKPRRNLGIKVERPRLGARRKILPRGLRCTEGDQQQKPVHHSGSGNAKLGTVPQSSWF